MIFHFCKPEAFAAEVFERGADQVRFLVVDYQKAVVEFPDYTRGGWKTAKPFTVDEIDMTRFDFSKGVTNDPNAQKV